MTLRAWSVIPALGALAALGAAALGDPPVAALAAGLLAAALTAAIRAYAGDEPAVLAGAATGALVGTAAALAAAHAAPLDVTRACLAGAAAAWTFVELVRPAPATARPAVALLPATIAAALDPAYVALVLVASIRYWRSPQRRGRWAIALPVVGAVLIGLAALALRAETGAFATLARAWTGAPLAHARAGDLLAGTGDVLGPLAALAALAGSALAATRGRAVALSLAALAVGSLATSLRAGAVAPSGFVLAGLAAGVAIAHLAALVRHPTGQACLGVTAGVLLLVTPAWTLSAAMR